MQRMIARRIIWPSVETLTYPHPIDLSVVAHSAAIETLQIDLVAQGWVGLFAGLLQPGGDSDDLVWLADGPGGEAEIKRAYSALFGRFFGRAILRHEHDCLDLQQVRDGRELAPGVHVRRRRGLSMRGDLPDWVSWNSQAGRYSICEAKGSYERANWRTRQPQVIRNALDQIARVEILDASGRQQTKDWVVASRWGTVVNGKEQTIVTVDPLSEGRVPTREEAETAARELHARFIADLLRSMGRRELAHSLEMGDGQLIGGEDNVAIVAGRPGYAALLIDGAGVIPLRGTQRRQRFEVFRDAAFEQGRKLALIAVERSAAQGASQRSPRPQDRKTLILDDGLTVASDGVTVTWNIEALEFPETG